MARLAPENGTATVIQITEVCRRPSLSARHVEKPSSRRATAAEDRASFPLLSAEEKQTESTIYTDSPKIGQQKIGEREKKKEKTFPGLTRLDFCCNVRMVGWKIWA